MNNVPFKNTISIKDENGNPMLFVEAMLMRKVSQFLLGADKDGIMPIPVLMCVKTGKILPYGLNEEMLEEYKDIIIEHI